MTQLRYYDKREYETQLQKEAEIQANQSKLKAHSPTMWLMGRVTPRTAAEISQFEKEQQFLAQKRTMSTEEVVHRTAETMNKAASLTHSRFSQKMPNTVHLPRNVESFNLGRFPHLCVSRFSQFERNIDGIRNQIHVCLANFQARLTPHEDTVIINLTEYTFSRMYLAYAYELDSAGNVIGLNKALGKNGIVFQTTVDRDAFNYTFEALTTMSPFKWQQTKALEAFKYEEELKRVTAALSRSP